MRLLTVFLPMALLLNAAASRAQPYGLRMQVDAPLIGLGLAMSLHSRSLLADTRRDTLDLPALDRADINPLDRWAVGFYSPRLSSLSGGLAAAELLIPVLVNAWDIGRGGQPWQDLLIDFLLLQEAAAISSSLSSYAKALRIHPTPLAFDRSVPDWERKAPHNVSSFFSGHTTGAFTTAVYSGYTFQLRHPESPLVPWVWGSALTAATGVGILRIAAGKHFPSDVLAGALVGSLCGYLVPRLHLRGGAGPSRHVAGPGNRSGRVEKPSGLSRVEMGVSFAGGSDLPIPTLQWRF